MQNVIIPEGQPRPGPFRHLVPAADGIMDALQDDEINTIVVRAPVQLMKTTLLINSLLYNACERPAPMLVFEPDDNLSKAFIEDKLDPIAAAIAELRAEFTNQPKSSRTRKCAGGSITILSGLAANPQVARSAKFIYIDEYRSFKDDLYQSIRGRATQYVESGAKIYATSSAGEHGVCRTTQLLDQSDWRDWRVPCPECGAEQGLVWDQVEWTDDDPYSAVYVCIHCHYKMTDDELLDANTGGRWVATKTSDRPGIAGFDCNFMASPFVSLSWGVGEFIAANKQMKRTGSIEQVKQFFEDWLAEPFKPGAGMRPDILNKKCRAPYAAGDAPDWVSNIILCVDVQDDRLEYEFSGWSAVEVEAEQDAHRVREQGTQKFKLSSLTFAGKFYQLRRAGLHYGQLIGDPGLADVWQQLDVLRCETRFRVGGRVWVRPTIGLIDSGGHHTQETKKYVHKIVAEYAAGAPQGCHIWGCKGASTAGQPLIRQSGHKDTRIDWGGNFYMLGVDSAKDLCHAMLRASRYARQKDKAAVYPAGKKTAGYDLKYFEGLCAEKKEYVTGRDGHATVRWFKDTATPNEPLDLYAYSLAAAHLVGISRMLADTKRIAERLAA